MVGKTKLVLVDDHELFVQAVKAAVELGNDAEHDIRFEVVGSASTGSAVLPLVERLRPDLVLLDIGLPGMDGLTCLELLRDRFPNVKVVMLSGLEQPEHVQTAISRGAAGFIMKTIDPRDISAALRQIVEGSVYTAAPASAASPAATHGLSARETEILRHLAQGLPNSAIAAKLFVTEQTVKFHLTSVYRKLGVDNRTAAAREAHRLGIAVNPHVDALHERAGVRAG
jgi:DNA-binding NarL/FixJ family response regulator